MKTGRKGAWMRWAVVVGITTATLAMAAVAAAISNSHGQAGVAEGVVPFALQTAWAEKGEWGALGFGMMVAVFSWRRRLGLRRAPRN